MSNPTLLPIEIEKNKEIEKLVEEAQTFRWKFIRISPRCYFWINVFLSLFPTLWWITRLIIDTNTTHIMYFDNCEHSSRNSKSDSRLRMPLDFWACFKCNRDFSFIMAKHSIDRINIPGFIFPNIIYIISVIFNIKIYSGVRAVMANLLSYDVYIKYSRRIVDHLCLIFVIHNGYALGYKTLQDQLNDGIRYEKFLNDYVLGSETTGCSHMDGFFLTPKFNLDNPSIQFIPHHNLSLYIWTFWPYIPVIISLWFYLSPLSISTKVKYEIAYEDFTKAISEKVSKTSFIGSLPLIGYLYGRYIEFFPTYWPDTEEEVKEILRLIEKKEKLLFV